MSLEFIVSWYGVSFSRIIVNIVDRSVGHLNVYISSLQVHPSMMQ